MLRGRAGRWPDLIFFFFFFLSPALVCRLRLHFPSSFIMEIKKGETLGERQ